jgi:hypothetical protein
MLVLVIAAGITGGALADDRQHGLLLTWREDPTTTMIVQWLGPTDGQAPAEPVVFSVRPIGDDDAEPRELTVEARAVELWPHRVLYRVELTDLTPDTAYAFTIAGWDRDLSFRTMPTDLRQPMRIAIGGDTRHRQQWMEQTNRVAMAYDPQFIVWGGDLAYADGDPEKLDRWVEWFDANDNTLIREDGRVVPVVVGIGNHEVQKGYFRNHEGFEPTDAWRMRIAPFFFQFFAFPGQPGYGVLDFGDYLSLVVLDTDHAGPIDGEQTRWLEGILDARRNVPHVLPVYHVPAYPSARPFTGEVSRRIREHWVPLFERFNIQLAFENHDHTYKRTHPLRGDEPHPLGVTYIGDGAWGVRTRAVHVAEHAPYLAHAESTRHAIILTLHGTHRHLLVVSEDGEVIDEYPRTPATE